MSVLFDTGALIRAERGAGFESMRAASGGCVATISIAELWRGVHLGQGVQTERRRRMIEKIPAFFTVVDFDSKIAAIHGRLWSKLRGSGEMLGGNDLIIAATAITLRSSLVTTDQAFERVPGLETILIQP